MGLCARRSTGDLSCRLNVLLVAALILVALVSPSRARAQTPFPAPQNLQATVDGSTVLLTWEQPSRPPAGWDLAGYRVYRDDVLIAEEGQTSHQDAGRPPGTYLYEVSALYREATATRLPRLEESDRVPVRVTVDEPPADDPPPDDGPLPDDPPPTEDDPPRGDDPPGEDDPPPPPVDTTPPGGGARTPPSTDGDAPPAEPDDADASEDKDPDDGEPGEPEALPETSDTDATETGPEPGPVTFDRRAATVAGRVLVRGDACPPGDEVRISIAGAEVALGTADRDGAFATAAPAPSQPGSHEVEVACGGVVRTAQLTVVSTTSTAGTSSSVIATVLLFFLLLGTALWPHRSLWEGELD